GWGTPPGELPGPADLLGAAFAACMLKNLARAGSLLGFVYTEAEVDVVLHRQDTPPKFTEITYDLRITTDEPQRRIDLVHANLSKFGTVYNTLAAVCDVHGEVRAAGV
ncbi:MAG: OsmC family protein, partial [Dermatophilaceae bacterium]